MNILSLQRLVKFLLKEIDGLKKTNVLIDTEIDQLNTAIYFLEKELEKETKILMEVTAVYDYASFYKHNKVRRSELQIEVNNAIKRRDENLEKIKDLHIKLKQYEYLIQNYNASVERKKRKESEKILNEKNLINFQRRKSS